MSSKKENKINPMKVMCAPNLDLAGKSACFKDDNENPAIIIDLKKMKRDGNQNIVAEELKKVLVHEFYHTSSQQIETPTEPGCADHAVIKSLESLCDETKKIEVAQDIKNCKVQAVVELSKTNLVIEDKQFRLATELGSQINRQGNQLQGSNNLTSNDLEGIRQTNADINTLSAPVPTAALARAESNQSPSLGSKTEITAGTPIETAVVSLYNSFSQNNTSISKALVVATSIVGSTTAIAQTQASVRANTVPYLQSEIIADKFQLPQSVVATSEQNFPSLQISNTTNATAADNKLPDVEVQKPPQKKIEVAGQNLNTDVKSDTALPSQQSVVIAVDNKISDRSIASVSIKTNPQIDTAARTTNPDTKILQTLGTVSKLSGQSYEDIKKMYNNPDFKNSLATRGIVIELNDSKRTKIGTNQKAKIIFKDNGKELSKVEDQ